MSADSTEGGKYRPQVGAEHYEKSAFTSLRIESITEQLRAICSSGYTNILEIGIGRGFLRHCFKLFPQIHHTTLDIAEDLHPDYVGSVTCMPFPDKRFELTVCCQVLEHLPFEDVQEALKEIWRVTRYEAVISVPDRTRRFGIALALGRLGWLRVEVNIPKPRDMKRKLDFSGEHYWEIGFRGTLMKDVIKKIKNAGFVVKDHYRLWRNPWHHFFVLRVDHSRRR